MTVLTLENLANLGEFLGGIGVISTVIYGFFEYRRARRDAEMQAAYEGEVGWSQFNLELAGNPSFALLAKRIFNPTARAEDFTPEELAQIDPLIRALFHRIEAQWYVSQRRGLPMEIWLKRRSWARATIETPMGRAHWEREKAGRNYTASFVLEIESAPDWAPLPFDYDRLAPGASPDSSAS